MPYIIDVIVFGFIFSVLLIIIIMVNELLRPTPRRKIK